MKCSGAGNVEVRSDLKREYGLELLKSGMVALLCPNCHWGYDHGSSTIRPEALQERAKLLFQQNHGLGKEMANTEVCLLVEEGFGRPQFRELCKEVKEAEGLTPVELNYTVPCSKQERALATLAQEKGVEDVKCEAPGCNAVDCLQIHGDTVRHAQLYNRLVQLLPSKKIVFVKHGVCFMGRGLNLRGLNLAALVNSGLLMHEQLKTTGILCRHHNLAVERSMDRKREERETLCCGLQGRG